MDEALRIKDIRQLVESSDISAYPMLSQRFYPDERKQVRDIACALQKKYEKYLMEQKRLDRLKLTEAALRETGATSIAGFDEVGRGPLCGPVVSAAVILPPDSRIPGVNDSKKLSQKAREELYDAITAEAVAFGVGIVENTVIDDINILNAVKLSMKKAYEALSVKPDMLVIDALRIDVDVRQKAYIKGDENIYSISAASIVAKVTRDRMMCAYADTYPEYHLASNKGYGTFEHIEAIREYGPTPIHRMSFLSSIPYSHSKNHFEGLKAEDFAVQYISESGCAVLDRNYRRAGGEVDIVFLDGETVVFCEVKMRGRSDYGTAEESVDRQKQTRLIATANKYMLEKGLFGDARFDIIALSMKTDGAYAVRHHQNAFTATDI